MKKTLYSLTLALALLFGISAPAWACCSNILKTDQDYPKQNYAQGDILDHDQDNESVETGPGGGIFTGDVILTGFNETDDPDSEEAPEDDQLTLGDQRPRGGCSKCIDGIMYCWSDDGMSQSYNCSER